MMFFAEQYNFAESFHNCRLIYPVLSKSAFVAVILICFRFVEKIGIGLFKGLSVEESTPSVGGGGVFGFAAVVVIMFIVLIPFFAFREPSLAIGKISC